MLCLTIPLSFWLSTWALTLDAPSFAQDRTAGFEARVDIAEDHELASVRLSAYLVEQESKRVLRLQSRGRGSWAGVGLPPGKFDFVLRAGPTVLGRVPDIRLRSRKVNTDSRIDLIDLSTARVVEVTVDLPEPWTGKWFQFWWLAPDDSNWNSRTLKPIEGTENRFQVVVSGKPAQIRLEGDGCVTEEHSVETDCTVSLVPKPKIAVHLLGGLPQLARGVRLAAVAIAEDGSDQVATFRQADGARLDLPRPGNYRIRLRLVKATASEDVLDEEVDVFVRDRETQVVTIALSKDREKELIDEAQKLADR